MERTFLSSGNSQFSGGLIEMSINSEAEYSLDLGLGGYVYILLEGKNWVNISTRLINLLNMDTS